MTNKKKNLIIEKIKITDAGARGVAIGKDRHGRVIMVKNAVPGDVADVRVLKKRRRYFEAEPTMFHHLSSKRTDPVCRHFGICGGCKWQNMRYKEQLFYKQKDIETNLDRIAGVRPSQILPIKAAPDIYFYRNKMEFSFSNKRWLTRDEINTEQTTEKLNALGFHIPGMWSKILDLDKCYLQADPSNDIRLSVKQYALEHQLEFFDLYKQSGFLRTLMIRTSSTEELMILIQFYREDRQKREGLLRFLNEKFNITSLLYTINDKANDSIYDLDVKLYAGRDHIFEQMEGLKFKIGPKSFYQTNSQQGYELYKTVRDFAELTGKEIIYDLYTGTGTIAQFIARKAKKVVGVELVEEAIQAAKENARFNKINNCTFHCGDMKSLFTQDFINQNGHPDIIITDPPRDGIHKKVVAQMLRIAPEKIIYVSCNSATQARDLKLMKEQYDVIKMQGIDLFPQTHHTENVLLLKKR